jgi:hypothetical protein
MRGKPYCDQWLAFVDADDINYRAFHSGRGSGDPFPVANVFNVEPREF